MIQIKNFRIPIFAYYRYERSLGEFLKEINLLDCSCLQDYSILEDKLKQEWLRYFVFKKSKDIGAKLEFNNLDIDRYNFIEIKFEISLKRSVRYCYLEDLQDIEILDFNMLGGDFNNFLRKKLQIPSIIVDTNRISDYTIKNCILKYPQIINRILLLSELKHIKAFIFPLQINNYKINLIFLKKDFFLNNSSIKFFDNRFHYFF